MIAIAVMAVALMQTTAVTVGSKKFTESVILGETAAQLLRHDGIPARHRREMGGTRVLWDALLHGDIDVYPEYTGTLREEIFAGEQVETDDELRAALARNGVVLGAPLGFDDTYALGVPASLAGRLRLHRISDLASHPGLRLAFSHEFLDRADGWPRLKARYQLPQNGVRGLDHDLAYRAIATNAIDVTDLYSTDAEIRAYHLAILEDDRRVFPSYRAAFVMRADLLTRNPGAEEALAALAGKISVEEMRAMNARTKLDRVPESQVASDFLGEHLGIVTRAAAAGPWTNLARRTREHLFLVLVSLLAAISLAVPLGVLAAFRPRIGHVVLAAVGIIQTIPSLALLVFMIPLLGIGTWPSVVALFLYSLLPIVRSTHAGLVGIAPELRDSARALGLPAAARLRLVELPLASPSILSGIKTSAVINVGTATLGALIGAGGYGQPILTGIRLDDTWLILQGAVPAALMALAAQGLFDLAERLLVPRGLRLGHDA